MLHADFTDSGKLPGSGKHEITVPNPSDAQRKIIADLHRHNSWRDMIKADHCCIGFVEALRDKDGNPVGELLNWASELHFIVASSYLLMSHPDKKKLYDFLYQFSLDSGSALSRYSKFARSVAQSGECYTGQGWVCHPSKLKTELEGPHLNAAILSAKMARYDHDAESRGMLLATGDAKLTAAIYYHLGTRVELLPRVQIWTMVVRKYFQENTTRDRAREAELLRQYATLANAAYPSHL